MPVIACAPTMRSYPGPWPNDSERCFSRGAEPTRPLHKKAFSRPGDLRHECVGLDHLESDGTLSKEIMPDYLHLSFDGYRIWAESIESKVAELLGEKN